jgi:hypothetical protein
MKASADEKSPIEINRSFTSIAPRSLGVTLLILLLIEGLFAPS